MSEPTFLGLSKSAWEMYNSFADWLSAIGTPAAVLTALHLARQAGRPKARCSVGHRIVITPGMKGDYPEVIVFRVVNTGDRPIRITQIGWKTGLWRKRQAIQLCDEKQSSRLPVELTHGQEAQWIVPLNAREEPWLDYFAKGLLSPNRRTAVFTLRAQFFTSVGTVFSIKPEAELLKKTAARIATPMTPNMSFNRTPYSSRPCPRDAQVHVAPRGHARLPPGAG